MNQFCSQNCSTYKPLGCSTGFVVACSTGFVDRGVSLHFAKQFLSCALVRGRGVVFRHYYKSIAKCAGKDYRDGAVVPFE